MSQSNAVVTLLVFAVTTTTTFGQASFRAIGEGPYGSYANAVSADGTTVVGYLDVPGGYGEAFRWTGADGFQEFGFLAGYPNSFAQSVSGDGSIVVGYAIGKESGPFSFQPFRWTAETGMLQYGDANRYGSTLDISDDGRVVVGLFISWCNLLGGAWNCSTNADGSVLVYGTGFSSRLVCEHGQAMGGQISGTAGTPFDISPDGNAVVGEPAFLWTVSGGLRSLGLGEAWGVSADGRVVVGGGPLVQNGARHAFIWDATNGRRVLKSVLENDYCLDLTGWDLSTATGISDDGLTIVGYGKNPDHFGRAWIARLPATPVTSETNCSDGIDNDCDGYTDCADPDCASNVVACPNGRIPAVSAWGLAVLTLATLTAGTVVLRRRGAQA